MDDDVDGRSLEIAGTGGARAQPRSTASVMLLLAGLAGVVVVLSLLFSGDNVRSGEQRESSTLDIVAAPGDGWVLLSASGEPRAEFPQPMVRLTDDAMCFGFGRTDFDEARPSLARCREPVDLSEDALVLLAQVTSGADEWHVLVFGSEVADVDVEFDDGAPLGADRVHLAGTAAALRIPNDRLVSTLRWESSVATYGCEPDASVVRTGSWCPGEDG